MSFLSLLPLIQLLSSVGLTIAGQYGAVPSTLSNLVSQLEAALYPLFGAIASGSTKTQDIQAGLGAAIGVLTVLKAQPGLDAALLAKIEEQLAASQDALAAEVQAAKGFDPAGLTPVEPIA